MTNGCLQFREERSSMGGVVGEMAKESAKERDERIKRENVREERRRDRERAYAMEKLGAESKKSKAPAPPRLNATRVHEARELACA
jgi:hypothetical protein